MISSRKPNQKWNVRREWSPHPADQRELYYSGIDRRIHLKGAKEGWVEIGYLGGEGPIGEIRMLDTDDNGFFDRWEVYLGDELTPARVTTVLDEKVHSLQFDFQKLNEFYVREVLPEAIDANSRMMAAMNRVHYFSAPEGLQKCLREGSANVRRYTQDVVRELHYQSLRRALLAPAHVIIRKAEFDDLFSKRHAPPNTETAWRMIRLLQDLDIAYGNGDFDQAIVLLEQIATSFPKVQSPGGF